MKKYPFIAFEGIDGSGKTSLIQSLRTEFQSLDIPIFTGKEPGDDTARAVNSIYKSNQDVASRLIQTYKIGRDKHQEHIKKYLPQGIYLCDRWLWSTQAYNGSSPSLTKLITKSGQNILVPDLTIYLKTDPLVAMQRLQKRTVLDTKFENLENLRKVSQRYDDIYKNTTWPVFYINSTKSQEFIKNTVFKKIHKLYRKSVW